MPSDADDSDATGPTRRSGRERKPVERLSDVHATKNKSKQAAKVNGTATTRERGRRSAADADSGSAEPEDGDEEEQEDDEEEEEAESESEPEPEPSSDEEFDAPKKRQPRSSGVNGKPKAAPRKKAVNGAASAKKAAAPRKGRGRKKAADADADGQDDPSEEEQEGDEGRKNQDVAVDKDNTLYNAVRNPNTDLQTIVDDWIETYQNDSEPAMAELINFVFRSSGCNAVLDEHQAADENGIVDVLETIQSDFKKSALLAYPLISKSKPLKKFRSSLTTFLQRLFNSTATSEVLYDDVFCQLFQSWLVSLSSSKIRSFRHTSTVIALASVTALCDVTVSVNKEFAQASRAKEAEEKKGRKDKARLKDLVKNVNEVHERKTKLEEYLKDLFEGVFVHRYRDSESIIRAECIRSLGSWMKVHPDFWLEGNYLRYIGWVLSDEHKDVRHDAIKALTALYAKDDHIGSMQNFTARFKAQFLQMATGEVDLSVRVSSINLLRQISKHGLIESDETDRIATLIFAEEARVRSAVAMLFDGLLDDLVAEREQDLTLDKEQENSKGATVEEQLRLKCLAQLLVKYSRALDGSDPAGEKDDDNNENAALRDDDEDEAGAAEADVEKSKWHRGRVSFAVESLWDQVPVVKNWQAIIDFLLLDHSEDHEGTPKAKSKAKAKSDELDLACRLTEDEETLMVEVLVAGLGHVFGVHAPKKQKEKEKEKAADEEAKLEATRVVIEALPRLFVKHQTVPSRVVDILAIPTYISLEVYLNLRMTSAYEALWDDVQKQLLHHTDLRVIDQAVKTIRSLLSATVLGHTNKTKMIELEDSLVTSLQDSVQDRDIEAAAFEEDELLTISACVTRINKLYAAHDISASLDENGEGKKSSAWEIIDSLSARARLGYKDEAAMVEQALGVLSHHLFWRFVELVQPEEETSEPDLVQIATLAEERNAYVEKLEMYSVGGNANAVERVKRCALTLLLEIYSLSQSITSDLADPKQRFTELRLPCSDELQARCAGFIEAEIERFSETLRELADPVEEADPESEDEDNGSDSESDDAAAKRKKKKEKAKKEKAKSQKLAKAKAPSTPAEIRAANLKKEERLVAAGQFNRVISAFVNAILGGVVDIRHASIILTHLGRFGPIFDNYATFLVNDLRDEGIFGSGAEITARVVIDSLKGACDLYLDQDDKAAEPLTALSRLLARAVVVRGSHLAIVKTLPAEQQVQIHVDCAAYAIRKLETFEEAKKKNARDKVLVLFKALLAFIIGLNGKSALQVKTKVDALVEASSFDVPASAKAWEPLRAYQKRLVTTMSKDPAIKKAAAKKAAVAEHSDADDAIQNSDAEQNGTPPAKKPRPKARRVTAASKKKQNAARSDGSDSEVEEVLPKRRATRRKQSPVGEDEEEAPAPSPKKRKIAAPATGSVDGSDDDEVESILLSASQKSSQKKRSRSVTPSEAEDNGAEEEEQQEGSDEEPERGARDASRTPTSTRVSVRPPDSQASIASVEVPHKKRARR